MIEAGWTLLDASDQNYSQYDHPAYYSGSLFAPGTDDFHAVLDTSQGAEVGNWTIISSSSGTGSGGSSSGGDGDT